MDPVVSYQVGFVELRDVVQSRSVGESIGISKCIGKIIYYSAAYWSPL